MLKEQELERYERQVMIPGWGEEGQRKLKKARVLVAGAGGLGSAILMYIAAAGVGEIKVVDSDNIELSNLNRQVIHSSGNIGKAKTDSAEERLKLLNPDIKVEAVKERITEANVSEIVEDCLIVDALDNLPARKVLNRAAVEKRLPLFHGAVYGFEGRATTIIPGNTPCISCLYKEVVPGKVPVAGVTPAVIGSIQATEVIKYVLGTGELLACRLLVYDGLNMRFAEVSVKRNPSCEVCGILT